MPINWSAVKVSEAMDMAEQFVNQAAEPLEQTEIVSTQARALANLPQVECNKYTVEPNFRQGATTHWAVHLCLIQLPSSEKNYMPIVTKY